METPAAVVPGGEEGDGALSVRGVELPGHKATIGEAVSSLEGAFREVFPHMDERRSFITTSGLVPAAQKRENYQEKRLIKSPVTRLTFPFFPG